jgi:xylose isomerase
MEAKFAFITALAGKTRDRFSEYQSQRTLEEKIELISQVRGATGVEIIFPDETPDPVRLRELLENYNLKIAAVNCNIKGDPSFRLGAIGSPDRRNRKKAVDLLKSAKSYAQAVGADKVHCAPLNDGYDYLFQVDYQHAWNSIVDSLREVCEHIPEMKLVIEYKESEPRVRCLVSNSFCMLSLCQQIGVKNLGATIDIGHSFYNGENPSEALCNFAGSGFPYYVHINDNNGKFDWDLMVGSWHTLNFLEFLFWLNELGYDDFLTFDVFPSRLDIVKTFESSIRTTERFFGIIRQLDGRRVRTLMAEQNLLELREYLESNIYR